MNILIVGGGGREHALAWAAAKSPLCEKLFCAPGNAGMTGLATCLPIGAEDLDALVDFASRENIGLVVVGPEAPLVGGLVDRLEALGIPAFGPNAKAAMLEGSKGFMKDLFAKYNIPTARYARFAEPRAAADYIRAEGAPIVVKADGLAAGKGVILAETEAEALDAVDLIMGQRAFGQAGDELVIEEFLEGEEASFFALVDGQTALPLVSAQDHKAAFDGDKGPNTGGMGAYSPAPVITPKMAETIMQTIIQPTIQGMAAEGRPYRGVLYAGLMITESGPKVLEYNVRFGDPECQVLIARLKSDLVALLSEAAEGRLRDCQIEWREEAALVVVMAARGYPGAYEKGSVIGNLERAGGIAGVDIFHAGTKADGDRVLANGGRVLGVTARGVGVKEARDRAYQAVDLIDWADGFWRRDIGWRALLED